MAWVKLDNKAPRHWKIDSLTDKAFRWWVKGLCYAGEFLTNGVLHPTFWKQVPKQSRSELTGNRLWDWEDPNFIIHDYLAHQTSRESVTQKRAENAERVMRYRERKRNAVTGNAESVTGNAHVTHPDTDTEDREQIQKTGKTKTTGAPRLIVGGGEYVRLLETNAFVGSVLRVPKKLHAELLGKSGGAHREQDLQEWYLSLNERLEASGKGTGDVFEWLRPRHQALCKAKGWVEDAAAVNGTSDRLTARLEAIARGEIKR